MSNSSLLLIKGYLTLSDLTTFLNFRAEIFSLVIRKIEDTKDILRLTDL